MEHYEQWFTRLEQYPCLKSWVKQLRTNAPHWLSSDTRADIYKWQEALATLPAVQEPSLTLEDGYLTFSPTTTVSTELLKTFHPWRKGPLKLGNTDIDTEWRSDWKWERLSAHVSLSGKRVLDIGCGNGYYLWRMVLAGAEWALGIDPYIPYIMQFQCMQHFAGHSSQVAIFPLGAEHLPKSAPVFDTVFSMGVLYHQKSPLEHLAHCRELLSKEGELLLETIILPPSYERETDCLVPVGRYAKMKNVNFIPSKDMLLVWLKKVRFQEVEVIDISQTSTEEQRTTDWMTFESLQDYLDPRTSEKTVEGHPAPWRIVIKARR